MKSIHKLLLLLLPCAAFAGSAALLAQAAPAPLVKTSATYRCDSSPSGECAFLLYFSTCTDGPPKNGRPVLLCTHEFFSEFSLKVGESRVVQDLPPTIRQCNAAPHAKPVFPDCAR